MNYTWWLKELKEVLIPSAKGEYRKAIEEEYCWTLAEFQREMEERGDTMSPHQGGHSC